MDIADIPAEVFTSGILDKEHHLRLIADLDGVTTVAGIPRDMAWSRLSSYCTEPELQWVRQINGTETYGLAYTGTHEVPIEDKMMAMAGAFLRNHIDARVMVVQEVVKRLKNDSMPTPAVLLIPNFCVAKIDGGDLPSWETSSLLGLLYTRMAKNVKTVIYVGSMVALEKQYGSSFSSHINAHYKIVS